MTSSKANNFKRELYTYMFYDSYKRRFKVECIQIFGYKKQLL